MDPRKLSVWSLYFPVFILRFLFFHIFILFYKKRFFKGYSGQDSGIIESRTLVTGMIPFVAMASARAWDVGHGNQIAYIRSIRVSLVIYFLLSGSKKDFFLFSNKKGIEK